MTMLCASGARLGYGVLILCRFLTGLAHVNILNNNNNNKLQMNFYQHFNFNIRAPFGRPCQPST